MITRNKSTSYLPERRQGGGGLVSQTSMTPPSADERLFLDGSCHAHRPSNFGRLLPQQHHHDTSCCANSGGAAGSNYLHLVQKQSAASTCKQCWIHRDTSMKILCHKTATLPTVPSETGSSTDDDSNNNNSSNNASYYSIKIPSSWTVGKVSLTFLLLAAFGDLALNQFRGLNHLEGAYDALSADVIQPAFQYKKMSAGSSSSSAKSKSSLGSAAIGSVTEVLSPILPFTGGVDLRREDYWTSSSPWETIQSLSTQLMDAFASPSLQDNAHNDNSASTKATKTIKRVKAERRMTLSASDPFIKTSVIADMTLSDVTETFRYATESSKSGFDEAKFRRKLNPDVKSVIAAMKDAIEKSRGKDTEDSVLTAEEESSMDALKFCAAMRIFAEWRLLRQIPDGYKGYAVGMSLGHKDVVQNVVKIEQAVHTWLDKMSDEMDDELTKLNTPSIAQLLQNEKDSNIHPNLPRLQDKTAAMGLLWVRRQLQYQTAIFGNALMVPKKYATTKDAVAAAYSQVYDRYHGWAVQKIFNYSFQAAPEAVEIYRHMNPRKLEDVTAKVRNNSKPPRATNSAATVVDDDSSFNSDANDDENPIIAFFQNIGASWDAISKKNENEHPVIGAFLNIGDMWKEIFDDNSAPSTQHENDYEYHERLVSEEMVKDASGHIRLYMEVVAPLLDNLEGVFAKLNMDDPTKV